jgi:hypothetical protein
MHASPQTLWIVFTHFIFLFLLLLVVICVEDSKFGLFVGDFWVVQPIPPSLTFLKSSFID